MSDRFSADLRPLLSHAREEARHLGDDEVHVAPTGSATVTDARRLTRLVDAVAKD
ncbi:hypothetical protein [Saccharothrix deserti]|uniref:hypothetical protein n=1 Tax=Saccharothrix deserti TaxID=2593674 RepID=UPI00131D20A1|nr:hypothetical protein [Saccharothrix deserti]